MSKKFSPSIPVNQYTRIAVDLAKHSFSIAAMDDTHNITYTTHISRDRFLGSIPKLPKTTFAFEAASSCHFIARTLQQQHGHDVILLKTRDVKAFAQSRQKNDINDAIAIARASLDPTLMHVQPLSFEAQKVKSLHHIRSQVKCLKTQQSNSLLATLAEFGYTPKLSKSSFANKAHHHIQEACSLGFIDATFAAILIKSADLLLHYIQEIKHHDALIRQHNKNNKRAKRLLTIPAIGPINASIFAHKFPELYHTASDFAASLGLVPRQHTTGGLIRLGSISKQGDRYARSMLVQGARSIVIYCKDGRCCMEV